MDSFENTIESYFLVFIFFSNWPMADQSNAVTLDNEGKEILSYSYVTGYEA